MSGLKKLWYDKYSMFHQLSAKCIRHKVSHCSALQRFWSEHPDPPSKKKNTNQVKVREQYRVVAAACTEQTNSWLKARKLHERDRSEVTHVVVHTHTPHAPAATLHAFVTLSNTQAMWTMNNKRFTFRSWVSSVVDDRLSITGANPPPLKLH